MSNTTLEMIESVEGHDDLYRSFIDLFFHQVVQRALPNVFHRYLVNSWPKVEMEQLNPIGQGLNFSVRVVYNSNWVETGVIDGSDYETNKQLFCDKLDVVVKEMSEKLLAKENSGNPWWHQIDKMGKRHSYLAQMKMGDKLYTGIHVRLAEIKFRGGTWNWYLKPDKHRTDWPVKTHKQGVAKSLLAAKAIIEDAWKESVVV